MLQRLLMAVLVACLAFPAVAAPLHCASQARAVVAEAHDAGHHGAHHQPAPQVPSATPAGHDCIGCAAPGVDLPAIAVAAFHGSLPPESRAALLIARQGSGPETPPPRS